MFPMHPELLADEVMESYVSWRQACAAVEHAYSTWRSARRGDRRLACAAHVAALDREQHAALDYERAIERLTLRQRPAPAGLRLAS
jgi:hypothetical protein